MGKKLTDTDKQIACMAFLNRENNKRHHYYEEEMKQYELMKAGDMAAVDESSRMMTSCLAGRLSNDPVRNIKYLFIANVTIMTRFAIEGGLDCETAYTISDLYINKMDACQTVEAVICLHRDMVTYFTARMAGLRKENVFSRPVIRCMDYIDCHLHMPIRAAELAEYVNLNHSYLSVLFKKETGISISGYVMQKRIDTAKNMLRYSDYSASQIGEILAFSSQSHFIRCFKKSAGLTPKEYRNRYFRENFHPKAKKI